MLGLHWWVFLCSHLFIHGGNCHDVRNGKRSDRSTSATSFGSDNSDLYDDGWVEIDDQGFPINSSPDRQDTMETRTPIPGFIGALTADVLGRKPRYHVLQASDGSVVYLVPGRRPVDRIPAEQDITVNEIFRLFDRSNEAKQSNWNGPGGSFGPRMPFRSPPVLPLPPPRMTQAFTSRPPMLFPPLLPIPRFPGMSRPVFQPPFGIFGPRIPPVQQAPFMPPVQQPPVLPPVQKPPFVPRKPTPGIRNSVRPQTPNIGPPKFGHLKTEGRSIWPFNRTSARREAGWPPREGAICLRPHRL
ncbi:hypothetical protein FGIG_03360 [Fasciola gigantica]|uniref:Uncharacterized protein n=1 Tax=Fasciola gigantica TaxID=46835 RepID=A0A504Z0Z7_FASGI|nr:hypothetical protein FGIG_03360 [Fasciola gigantica]